MFFPTFLAENVFNTDHIRLLLTAKNWHFNLSIKQHAPQKIVWSWSELPGNIFVFKKLLLTDISYERIVRELPQIVYFQIASYLVLALFSFIETCFGFIFDTIAKYKAQNFTYTLNVLMDPVSTQSDDLLLFFASKRISYQIINDKMKKLKYCSDE